MILKLSGKSRFAMAGNTSDILRFLPKCEALKTNIMVFSALS